MLFKNVVRHIFVAPECFQYCIRFNLQLFDLMLIEL